MGLRWEALKAFATGRGGGLQDFFMPRHSSPPERNTQEWLEAYGKNPRLAPVTKIATDLSSIPGKLYRVDRQGKETEIEAHPFLDFMAKPNPLHEITASAFWRLMEIYLMIKGEAFAVIERTHDGLPAELWPLPPNWIMETPYIHSPCYKVLNGNGQMQPIPIDNMFVMKELNPVNPYRRGLGTSEAIADEVETYEYMIKRAKRFFFNDATPPFLMSVPGMSEDAYKRFDAYWSKRHQGTRNAFKPGIIPFAAEILRLSDNQKEMEFAESMKDLRDSSNAHYAIPPEVLGLVENSNRATAGQSKIIYAENVLSPRKDARQDAVNNQLVKAFGDDLIYKYDDIVPQDQEFELQKATEGMKGGAIGLEEWREKNGFDECKEDAVLLLPYNMIPVRYKDLLTANARGSVSITPSPPVDYMDEPADEAVPPADASALPVPAEGAQEKEVAEVSLNGAQISSLLEIVVQVKQDILDRESAIEIITSAFPFGREKAEKILGDAVPPVT